MIALALFLSAAVQNTDHFDNPVANWKCADPLIKKNYSLRVDPQQLALRVADECAQPYNQTHAISEYERTQDESLYLVRRKLFVSEIQGEIEQARRKQAIPLRR